MILKIEKKNNHVLKQEQNANKLSISELAELAELCTENIQKSQFQFLLEKCGVDISEIVESDHYPAYCLSAIKYLVAKNNFAKWFNILSKSNFVFHESFNFCQIDDSD